MKTRVTISSPACQTLKGRIVISSPSASSLFGQSAEPAFTADSLRPLAGLPPVGQDEPSPANDDAPPEPGAA